MCKRIQTIALVSVFITTLTAASALYADGSYEPSGSKGRGGMRGDSRMMGTSRMMDQCGAMMQGGTGKGLPNDQWRKDAPTTPDKDG